jgi:NADP-dependent 3-hydroxy acid dehydrogenase YdfG
LSPASTTRPPCRSLTARRGDRLAEVAEKITAGGGVASHVVADVADREQAANAVSSTVDKYGRLDIVVHSAGMGVLAPVEGADLDLWHTMVNVNLLGVLNITHAAVPHLLRQDCSDLLVISSHSGRLTTPTNNVTVAEVLILPTATCTTRSSAPDPDSASQ